MLERASAVRVYCAGDFLYNRWKERNGVLQRFVEPKGTRNGEKLQSTRALLVFERQMKFILYSCEHFLWVAIGSV